MDKNIFESVVAKEYEDIPLWVKKRMINIVILIEDVVSIETRRAEMLGSNETLLGLYRGIPHTARGDGYGVGNILPDTITLYKEPIVYEAKRRAEFEGVVFLDALHLMVRETLWHEIGHSIGLTEQEVRSRENKKNNKFKLSPHVRIS